MLAAYEHGEDINSGGGRRRSQPWKVAISIPLPG
jgi:thiamine biosynthesis lipoprotein ApbE